MRTKGRDCVFGFGESLMDVFPMGEVIGGAPLNFAIRAAELAGPLGYRTAMCTRVGQDARGKQIIDRLRDGRVDCTHVQLDPHLPTGTVHIQIENGQPEYSIDHPAAWDSIEFTESLHQVADQAAAICFGTLAQRSSTTAQTLGQLLRSVPHAVKVLDLNLRKPWPTHETVIWSLRQADILKCNDTELSMLASWILNSSSASHIDIAEELQKKFDLRCVFWTRGEKGCVWQTERDLVEGVVPNLPATEDADAVGAGDAACAALVVGIIENWSAQRIVEVANLCGAFAASQRGATVQLPRAILNRIFAP